MNPDPVSDQDLLALTARAGLASHDLVGWMMWDPRALADFEALGVTAPKVWILAWRLAPLGNVPAAVAAATTYSVHPAVVEAVLGVVGAATTPDEVLRVRDDAVLPGLAEVSEDLASDLGLLATDLWRAIDAVHAGARPLFAAHRARAERAEDRPGLSAWLAVNCIREFRGDNHWALCAAADLNDVEVGLLHSVMVDVAEYGDEEWIARSRGADDAAIDTGWRRLADKGLATGQAINDEGRRFRRELEFRTDQLTAPVWREAGIATTQRFCELVEPHHESFVARIDATAGPRWMPAVRTRLA